MLTDTLKLGSATEQYLLEWLIYGLFVCLYVFNSSVDIMSKRSIDYVAEISREVSMPTS